jgi:hypothetical protein
MGDLEKAGDTAGDVGVGATEFVLDEATGGAVSAGVEYIKKEFGVDLRQEAKDGLKSLGEAGGGAMYDATSEETHQAALHHYENAGAAYDKGDYVEWASEGAQSVGVIAEDLLESAGEKALDALDAINPFSD